MSSTAPLRDRAPSNATHDWKPHATTPLRITKRDSPQPGAEDRIVPALTPSRRRSVRNLAHGARVTNSPFVLSQVPPAKPPGVHGTPTRKVSGEKRPRTHSMNNQAENENPAVRKRRQSQVSELLVQKKPVSSSVFKSSKPSPRRVSQEARPPAPVQPQIREQSPQTDQIDSDSELAPPPPPKEWFGRVSPHRSQSPSRPSLVSKRLHGPRSVRRHSRRKTVTFDEKCDVLEFDVEEENSNPFDWVTDDDDNYEHHDRMNLDEYSHDNDIDNHENHRGPLGAHNPDADESFDSFQVRDDSITGLVDSMLQDARPSTPPQDDGALPEDMETEDGVPYGRSHHTERVVAAHQHQKEASKPEPINPQFSIPTAISTPLHSREGTPIMSVSLGSHIPLGRSTHPEHFKAQEGQEADDDLYQLPPSPSPSKPQTSLSSRRNNTESLIPRFALDVPNAISSSSTSFDHADPFSYPQLTDIPHSADVSMQVANRSHEESGNLSIGNSEVSLSGLNFELEREASGPRSSTEESRVSLPTSTPPTSPPNHPFMFTSFHSNLSKESLSGRISTPNQPSPIIDAAGRAGSPARFSPLGGSPFSRTTQSRNESPFARHELPKSASNSSLNSDANGSLSGRSPRITRESVQQRLEKQRSLEGPLRDSLPGSNVPSPLRRSVDSPTQAKATPPTSCRVAPKRIPPPKITRETTHDGVMSLDPDPESNGPPRPALLARSHSDEDIPTGQASSLANLSDMKSALDRLMADVAGEATLASDEKGAVGLKVEAVTEGIQAGRFTVPEPAEVDTDESNDAMDDDRPNQLDDRMDVMPEMKAEPSERPDSLLHTGFLSPEPTGTAPSRPTSPKPQTKEAIRAREQLIKATRQRRREKEETEETDADTSTEYITPRRLSSRRSTRLRSRSTGETAFPKEHVLRKRAETLVAGTSGGMLDSVGIDEEDPLSDSIDRELRKLKGPNHTKYHVRERPETIYAIAEVDKVTHVSATGSINKAWRPIRRSSDMNEYTKQIRELRARSTDKALGKIFVRVIAFNNVAVPLPSQKTIYKCTMNNSRHYVSTPPAPLERDCRINQEFELDRIEGPNLEMALIIHIEPDQHILDQMKANVPPPRPPPTKVISPPPPKGGMSRFFGGQKKSSKARSSPVIVEAPPPPYKVPENFARYLAPDYELGKAYIKFADIAKRCDTRVFEVTLDVMGHKFHPTAEAQSMKMGELTVQFYWLPALPGIPHNQLPSSLDQCRRGIDSVAWHRETYYEGTLTQNGGDCTSWRRRHLRIIGAKMVAYNDITRKAIATIELKKAVAVLDDREPSVDVRSPDSAVSARNSRYIDHDGPYGIERAFKLVFQNHQEITFFADTDEEKAEWLQILRRIVGNVPAYPLWAEAAWQRREDLVNARAGSRPQPQQASASPVPAPPKPEPSRAQSPIAAPRPRRPMSRQG